MKIYTLGTAGREPYEFTKILNKYRIDVVVDVRRYPHSKFPHFNRENIEKLCRENKIEYLYLGNELGGMRKESYDEFMETAEFKRGLDIVKKLSRSKVVCLLCTEKYPGRCHRFRITQKLKKDGFDVVHIIDIDKVWEETSSK